MSVFGWVCTVQSREVGCRDGDGRPPAAWPRLRHFSQLLSPRKRVPPPGPASPIPTPPAGRCLCLGAPCLCLSAPGATNAMIVAVIVCSSYFTEQTHNVSDTCPHDVYPMVGGGCFVDMWDTTQGAVGQVSLDSMWRSQQEQPAGAARRSSPQEQERRQQQEQRWRRWRRRRQPVTARRWRLHRTGALRRIRPRRWAIRSPGLRKIMRSISSSGG